MLASMRMGGQWQLTETLNAYARRRFLSQALCGIGVILLCLGIWGAFLESQSLMLTTEQFHARVPVTELPYGDRLFWWLNRAYLIEHPERVTAILWRVMLAGILALTVGYVVRPKRS